MLKDRPGYLSGEAIGGELSISRSAVWKHVGKLKESGYTITSSTQLGYKLLRPANAPLEMEVAPYLDARVLGRRIDFHDVIDSTNREAVDLARGGADEGVVIVADRQTAGRGRLRRTWVSPPGKNLYFSVILRPDIAPARVPQLALLTAVAVHRALAGHCPTLPAVIKWPNDILVGGKKLAGILCETGGETDRVHYAVVGIGINVNGKSMPRSLRGTATSLRLECGGEYFRPHLLADVLNRLEEEYRRWRAGEDLRSVMPYLESCSALQGRTVAVATPGGEVRGRVAAISPRGELEIETSDGVVQRLSGGDVSLRPFPPRGHR